MPNWNVISNKFECERNKLNLTGFPLSTFPNRFSSHWNSILVLRLASISHHPLHHQRTTRNPKQFFFLLYLQRPSGDGVGYPFSSEFPYMYTIRLHFPFMVDSMNYRYCPRPFIRIAMAKSNEDINAVLLLWISTTFRIYVVSFLFISDISNIELPHICFLFNNEKKNEKYNFFSSYRLHLVPLKCSINSFLFNLVLSHASVPSVSPSIRLVRLCAVYSVNVCRIRQDEWVHHLCLFYFMYIFKAINCALFRLSEFLGFTFYFAQIPSYTHIDTTSSGISITCYTRDLRVLWNIFYIATYDGYVLQWSNHSTLGPVVKFEMHTWLCLHFFFLS